MILKESRSPEVGPFFVIDGVVYPFTEDYRTAEGGYPGLSIGGSSVHYKSWRSIKALVPEARDKDYDYYPRGRVTYDVKKDTFNLYLDHCITADQIENIIDELNLPRSKTEVKYDEHYQCHMCNSSYVDITENYEYGEN